MNSKLQLQWIKLGIISGFITLVVYPLMIFVEFPVQITLVLALSFGILFMLASIGLYFFVSAVYRSAALHAALLFNILGCTVVVMMFTIQLALFSEPAYSSEDAPKELLSHIFRLSNLIQLSLDVVWDVFISLGTILFAASMFKHPKLGRIIGSTGIILGGALLFNNIYTFPIPPAETGYVDFGPLVALWYFAVTVMILRSINWAKQYLAGK